MRLYSLALGGLPQQPPPEAFFANATIFIGTRGLAAAATPRGVLRKRDYILWHSGERRSSHPPHGSSQTDLTSVALWAPPQHPPPEPFFTKRDYSHWHSGAPRSSHPPRCSSQT